VKTRCWGIGFGLNFRVVALDPSFRRLSREHIISAYKRTGSRAFLLDYDGPIVSQASVNKTPSQQVLSVLNALCSDANNVAFIVSGRSREDLSRWFSPCKSLGIAAEHGYYLRYRCIYTHIFTNVHTHAI
jgi:trehalose 6-phosphate synthase/phosphatase